MATKKSASKKKAATKKATSQKSSSKTKQGASTKKASASKKTTRKQPTRATTTTAGGGGNGGGDFGEHLVSADIRDGYIAGNTFGLKEIRYTAVDGMAIFEGDIVLGSVEEMEAFKERLENPPPAPSSGKGKTRGLVVTDAAGGARFRWPNGVIPFRIDAGLPNQQRVTDAINHWQNNTGIRFVQRTNQANFVTFRQGSGCNSQVGMQGGEQFVNLAAGCSTGNVIHEIGHVVGLWHEQSRQDRDNFVQIVWNNIQQDAIHNFDQHITDGDDVGRYDYGSIMHYPSNAFAIDTSKPTIIAPQPIGQRTGLSTGDVAAVTTIYPNKVTLGDTSTNGPALATKGSEVLLGWTGTGNLQLNFMRSTNGTTFTNKVTLGDTSPAALALAFFNGRWVVAWIGVGNNRLNIMQSTNGQTWTNKVTLGDTSQSAPALAVLGNQLFIAWRGVGNNQLNVMRSLDGMTWSNKVTLGDTTTSGPGLAALGSTLLLAWRGVGNNQLNVMRSSNGTNWSGKVTLGETTTSKVGISVSNNRAYLTWQGVGNLLLNVLASDNGQTWSSKFTSSQTCIDGPVITNIGTRLVWGWTGTNPAHNLNTMVFNVA